MPAGPLNGPEACSEACHTVGLSSPRGGPLFCTLAGGPVSAVYVRNMLRRIAAKAGVDKRVHPHRLRHTHAAELVREGTPVNVIRDQLGHSSLAVTDRYLRDIAPADLIALGRSRTWTADSSCVHPLVHPLEPSQRLAKLAAISRRARSALTPPRDRTLTSRCNCTSAWLRAVRLQPGGPQMSSSV
jgi:hypothetical protein